MNELLLSLVALVAAGFWTYRSVCQLRFRRRVRQERFRGLRIVIDNTGWKQDA